MAKPAYAGPKPLAEALSELRLAHGEDAKFHREGLRADSEYRDLGLAARLARPAGALHLRPQRLDHVPLRGRGGRGHGDRRLRAVAACGRAAQRDRAPLATLSTQRQVEGLTRLAAKAG